MIPHQAALSQRACRADGGPISVLMAKTLAHPELISLAAGFVDHQTLPVEVTRQAVEAIWSDPSLARAALQYGTTIGYPPLRQAVLEHLLECDGRTAGELNLSIEQVVVTAGSNQLLFLVSDILLDPGDVVLCSAPTYFVFLGTLSNLGARAVGVEVDQEGMIPAAIEAELARWDAAGELPRVKAIYVTTYYDNPSGVTMSASRRAALVDIARRWSRHGRRIYLIEDAAYRELRYYGDDTASLRSFDPEGDTVVHAGTFSKSFSPGIRVGWGILPPALLGSVLAAKGNLDFGSPHFNQVMMAAVMRSGLFAAHLGPLRESYRKKLDVVVAAAEELLTPIEGVQWVRPTGGLYVWLRLPEQIDTGLSGPLFDRAIEHGVLYVPGEHCYPRNPPFSARRAWPPKNMIRLSFGIPSCDEIRRGVRALAYAIREVLA